MECNRDEAIRARDIAEKKYAAQDFVGAKKFVLKAQRLFPDLDGISQMLAVLDVHHVAQTKVSSNDLDWYGILQVGGYLSFPFNCNKLCFAAASKISCVGD
jgi:hypothetical protein